MPQPDTNNRAAWIYSALGWLHRNVLLLLVGCYVLAAVAEGPGLAIRNLSFRAPAGDEIRAPMLLIALLLFCAAALIRWPEAVHLLERPGMLAASLVAVWLGPVLFAGLLGLVIPQSSAQLMVGVALVAAMPVANSSVGWSQTSGGNTALGLALVVLSILVSPLATPAVLRLMGFVLSEDATASIAHVVNEFSGWKFIVWVILPSLAGMGLAAIAGRERIERMRPWLRTATVVSILLLNYANASLAMPKLKAQETPATLVLPVLLAGSIAVLGIGMALLVAWAFRVSRPSRTALMYALSMKHTGLALVLAGELLSDEPRVLMVIMLATLLQHMVAGVVDRRLSTLNGNGGAPTDSVCGQPSTDR